MRHRIRLGRVRAALRVRGRFHFAVFLVLLNQRVNDARVFAVDARDAAEAFDFLERIEKVFVADHHCRIRHIHLERRDALLEHLRNLCLYCVIPVVDGHVEAVVAA